MWKFAPSRITMMDRSQKILNFSFFVFSSYYPSTSTSYLWSYVWMLLCRCFFFPLGQISLYRVSHTHFFDLL